MPTWIEFHCEEEIADNCANKVGSHPIITTSDTLEEIRLGIVELTEFAKAEGWEKTRIGWICHRCLGKGDK